MPFSIDFRNELKEKVKTKMVYDSIQQRKVDNEKTSADKKAWKAVKETYEKAKAEIVDQLAEIKFKRFKDWNKILYEYNQTGVDAETKSKAEATFNQQTETTVNELLAGSRDTILLFI